MVVDKEGRPTYQVDTRSGSSEGRRVKLPGKVQSQDVRLVDQDGRELVGYDRLIFWELVEGAERVFTAFQAARGDKNLKQ